MGVSSRLLVFRSTTGSTTAFSGQLHIGTSLTGIQYDQSTKWPTDYHRPATTDIQIDEGSTPTECLRGLGP